VYVPIASFSPEKTTDYVILLAIKEGKRRGNKEEIQERENEREKEKDITPNMRIHIPCKWRGFLRYCRPGPSWSSARNQ
jgi:hypothetical protein